MTVLARGSSRRRRGRRGGGIRTRLLGPSRPVSPPPPPPPAPPTRPQPKAPVQVTPVRNDQALEKTKKPQITTGAPQNIATAGETVPIVFGRRANNVGGVWLTPSMVKSGSNRFVGSYLYAISQGSMVGTPSQHLAYSGDRNIKYRADSASITLTHYYSTAAAMAAAPNSCPITSGCPISNTSSALFCKFENYTYLHELFTAGTITDREPDYLTHYHFFFEQTRGTGDVSNTVLQTTGDQLQVFSQETGADNTNAYWTATGGVPATTQFLWNTNTAGTAAQPAGNIRRFPATGFIAPGSTITGTNENFVFVYSNVVVNNQFDPSIPATTGTLEGLRFEDHAYIDADPCSPAATDNFQDFADITFLEIRGDLFDEPSAGNVPTTTRQLAICYEEGISVDRYSVAKVGGAYTTGSSNQFVDLAMHLFTTLGRVNGAATADIAAPIDTSNLITLASFCTNNATFFNGVIEQQVNVIEYLSKTAPFFLLRFISSNGRYSFQPILPITGAQAIDVTALTVAKTFTDSDILPGTYNKTYAEAEQRRDVIVSLVWRKVELTNIGGQATTNIRFSTTSLDAPLEQFDLTDCCTSSAHAELFGKYQLAFRKHVTHSISFSVPLDTTGLIPTQIIKVQRSRVSSVGDNRTETEHYQIEKITHSTEGVTSIEATHFPLTAGNVAEISNEIVNGSFTVR